MALEERLVLGDVLGADRPHPWFELFDPIDQQEGIAVRDETPYLRGS
jgi:hypothetical protein